MGDGMTALVGELVAEIDLKEVAFGAHCKKQSLVVVSLVLGKGEYPKQVQPLLSAKQPFKPKQ